MISILQTVLISSSALLLGCEGRPKSVRNRDGNPGTSLEPGRDIGVSVPDTQDRFDSGNADASGRADAGANDSGNADASGRADAGANDSGTTDASGRADTGANDSGTTDASGRADAGANDSGIADASGSADAGANDSGIADASGSEGEGAVDAGVGVLACNDLQVSLDEFSCVTDPETISIFGSEFPRKIKILGFESVFSNIVGCPSRNAMLHERNQPLFISLMADRDSIPLLQLSPDANLSQLAEDFISSINGVHSFVPADGFFDGAVGVWQPDPGLGNGAFIFDAGIEGLNLIYNMQGYSCNYQGRSSW